jgi:transcriptional regulator with XRE-family HTH domain
MATDATAGVIRLAALRRRVPWTQRELAAAAGVSVATIRGLEQGGPRCPRPRVIRALAAALGVPPAAVAEFRLALGLPRAGPAAPLAPRAPPRGRVGGGGGQDRIDLGQVRDQRAAPCLRPEGHPPSGGRVEHAPAHHPKRIPGGVRHPHRRPATQVASAAVVPIPAPP